MELLAPAKINLYLEVIDRRPDGYHNIESIMHTVSLYDRLRFEPRAEGLTLSCSRPDLPTDKSNLVLKAAYALQKELGTTAGAHITLEKNIPLGAGLGGGSSDAAAVLKGLLRLWNRTIEKERLNALAARIGADVPFFLEGGTAFASGIGEKLEMMHGVRPSHFILVYPGFPVSTPWVYKNLRFPLTTTQKINKIMKLLVSGETSETWGIHMFNRLEEVVFPEYPMLQDVRKALEELGCKAAMSGSGSTVFGLVSSSEDGERIRSKLKEKWECWLVQSVTEPSSAIV